MDPQKALAHYCEDHVLEIPNDLFGLRDIKPVLFNIESSIFYKDLESDLVNIEFHTQEPCIVYIQAGHEVITTSENRSIEVGPGEVIYLPKGLNLHSDYFHTGAGLNAFLLFIGADVLAKFLSTGEMPSAIKSNQDAIIKLKASRVVQSYFVALHTIYNGLNNPSHLLELKLLEVLHLLELNDGGKLRASLMAIQKGGLNKRNIKRLVDQYAISNLSSKQLAVLSGRSLSTFNRDFKTLYGATPKQWLIDQRLEHAHKLLSKDQWSVTDTAMEVGYSNVSHFIAVFRKKYGKTPYEIKQQS
ncbi:MAG: AraC family transcriptional regulator [Candidatus Thiodiazotropha sp. (ex Ctena orbiculata)]|nr:AraC family transcriptional regulator [Candidatus Thiodiazotropha taylori]